MEKEEAMKSGELVNQNNKYFRLAIILILFFFLPKFLNFSSKSIFLILGIIIMIVMCSLLLFAYVEETIKTAYLWCETEDGKFEWNNNKYIYFLGSAWVSLFMFFIVFLKLFPKMWSAPDVFIRQGLLCLVTALVAIFFTKEPFNNFKIKTEDQKIKSVVGLKVTSLLFAFLSAFCFLFYLLRLGVI